MDAIDVVGKMGAALKSHQHGAPADEIEISLPAVQLQQGPLPTIRCEHGAS